MCFKNILQIIQGPSSSSKLSELDWIENFKDLISWRITAATITLIMEARRNIDHRILEYLSWKGSTRIIESNLMLNPIYMSAQNLLPCCPVLFQVLWCQLVSPASAAVTLVTCSRVIAESHFSISLYHLRAALLKSPFHLCTQRGGYLWALSKSKLMCSNAHTLSGCRLLLGNLFPLKWKFVMFQMIKLSQYVFRSQFGICCIFP